MNERPSHMNEADSYPMFEVTSLGSGSNGNALLVRTNSTTLLVDCGVGARRMAKSLASFGLTIEGIDALLLSHEHSDHIRELPRFAAIDTPILCTRGTARAAGVPPQSWHEMRAGLPTCFGGLEIYPIPVSHDAIEPSGFFITTSAGSLTVLTDLGRGSPEAMDAITASRLIVVEANHDEAMLRRGPYPVHLQRRILSDSGHLSNADCAQLLANALRRSSEPPTVWLAHLSETNNRPQLAKNAVEDHLGRIGIRLELQILPRREASPVWKSGGPNQGRLQLMLEM